MRTRCLCLLQVLLATWIVVGSISWSRRAAAGEKEDQATTASVEKILTTDVANANFGDARKKLKGLLDRCKKGCSPAVVAKVHVALGVVSAQIGQSDDAKASWAEAFTADRGAQAPASASASVKKQFDEAQKAWALANPAPDDAAAAWVNKQAYELAKAAVAAEAAGNFTECIEKDKAALTQEENLRARMHLALCESKNGKIVDALRDNSKALESARAKNDAAAAKLIAERVQELLPRLAHVKFEAPKDATGLKIVFDDRPIPPERAGESFTIDPGTHGVKAEGVLRGVRVQYDDKVEVKEGETATVKITLKPAALTQGQLECMVAAKTQEEIQACLPQDKKPLVVHAGLDVSGYTDSMSVHVLTPGVRGSVNSPTGGWNVGASYLVDVLSAASPDVVATASRRFHDVRHAASATGGYKPGNYGGQVFGAYSQERDYISRTVGGTFVADVMDKQLTPQLGYSFSWDTIGRTGTDYDVFGKPFNTHTLSAGTTVILSPISLLVVGATVGLESGDQSKPYRYISLFAPGVSVPAGASPEEVNQNRLPTKPLEQLPLSRQRYSIAGRYILRMRQSATLRVEERLYTDSWGTKGSTTDFRYLMDLSSRLRVWPHVHLHGQTGADFYNRVYGATLNSDGSATIPAFRSSDRELSPMIGITLGGGTRYALTEPSAKIQLGVFASVDALYNQYFNSLFVQNRLAGYGTVGIEADFE